MEGQPQNPEYRINPENFHPCNQYNKKHWERSGSVVECLTRDRGAAVSSLTGVTVLYP